jgi:hypothetical protein
MRQGMRKPGRLKSDNPKLLTSIRLSAEVIDFFKAEGAGWQTQLAMLANMYQKTKRHALELILNQEFKRQLNGYTLFFLVLLVGARGFEPPPHHKPHFCTLDVVNCYNCLKLRLKHTFQAFSISLEPLFTNQWVTK